MPPRLAALLAPLLLAACIDPGDNAPGVDADVTVDAEDAAPETTLTATPDALDNAASVTFEFTSDRAATFRCVLDDGEDAPCTSPHVLDVTDGDHAFEVTAIAESGAADPTPARHAWKTDTVAPDTTFLTTPAELDNSTTVSFEFTATELAAFTCTLDGVATPCTSPHVAADLVEGAHTFTVIATDAAGNVEPAPALHAWTIDSSTPDTQIEVGPTGAVASHDATFAFSSPDAGAGASFECALDDAAWAACTSPVVLTGLALGTRVFEVRVRDASGNVDPTPARRTWTIDDEAPAATIAGPALTRDATPTFTFTFSGDPAAVECRFDAAAFAACTSPHEPADPLADGLHALDVRVVDAAGNTSTASHAFLIDTVAPVIELAPVASPTSDRTPTFTFTVAGAPSAVECRFDAAAFAPCTSPHVPAVDLTDGDHALEVRATDAAGNVATASRTVTVDSDGPVVAIAPLASPTADATPSFAFTVTGAATEVECRFDAAAFAPCTSPHAPSADLADGAHTFEVRATDAAGNVGTANRAITIDTVAPAIQIAPVASPTSDRTPAFTFTVTGEPSAVECRFGAAAFAPCTSPVTPAADLADGAHTLEVRATDAAGNVATATRAVTIDTVAPAIAIAPVASPTGDSTPTFTFSIGGAPTVVECRVDAGAFTSCGSPFTPADAIADGAHTLEVRAADAAGNSGTASLGFAIDTAAPVVEIAPVSSPTNDATPTFSFTVTGGAAVVECRFGAGTFSSCTSPHTPSVALTDGAQTLEVRAADLAGNVGTATRAVTIDTVAPTITILTGVSEDGWTNDSTPTWTFTTSPDSVSWDCWIGTDTAAPCTTSTSYTVAAPIYDGAHVLVIRVRDAAGNSTFLHRDFSTDVTPPSLTISNWPTPATAGGVGRFEWNAPTAVAYTCALTALDEPPSTWTSCTTPHDHAIPPQTGAWAQLTFHVRAYDQLGNVQERNRTFSVAQPN